MKMRNVGSERRKAVAAAWKNEKSLVMEGKGTRNWTQKEQRELIAKGKVKGYQGHHMKSVDGHNSKAGDANNIQFLTRQEHLQAHKGNYRNHTNGCYDPESKTMKDFGRSRAGIESKPLSQPLNDSQKKYATKKAEQINGEKRAQARQKREAKLARQTPEKTARQSPRSKTLASQRAKAPAKASNLGTQSKTLASQRSTAAAKGSTTASGRSSASGYGTSGGRGTGTSGGRSGHGGHGGHGH